MKLKLIVLLIVFSVNPFVIQLFGDEPPGKILDITNLNADNQKRMSRANVLVEKAISIWNEAEGLNSEIDRLESEFRYGKANKIVKKKERLLLHAAAFYRDGNKSQFNILEDELEIMFKANNSNDKKEVIKEGKELFVKARKARSIANNKAKDDVAISLHYDAISLENQAISLFENSINKSVSAVDNIPISKVVEDSTVIIPVTYSEEKVTPAVQPPVIVETTVPESVITETPISESVPVDTQTPVNVSDPVNADMPSQPISSVVTEPVAQAAGSLLPAAASTDASGQIVAAVPIIVASSDSDDKGETVSTENESLLLFFSIQILADKKEVPSASLSKVYSGSLPVIHIQSDGWHRYMAGRFKSLEDARKSMTQESIKGFIVAYNGEKRITIQEAVNLLKNNN